MTGAANLPPLIARLLQHPQALEITAENIDAALKAPGLLLLFFTEDPVRYRETLDLAVVAPELLDMLGQGAAAGDPPVRLGVLLPEAARACQPRYGFRRWPAFVLLRDGQYLGAIDGMRTWEEYGQETVRLLQAAPTRPPAIGIAVRADGQGDASDACH